MTTPMLSALIHEYVEKNAIRSAKKVQQVFRIDDKKAWEGHSTPFCAITVNVPDPDEESFTLKLTDTPHNDTVQEIVEEHEGQFTVAPTGATIELTLKPKDDVMVRDLAKAIRRVTGRGQDYSNSNWKWITKRTAGSLDRLADVLKVVKKVKPEWNLASEEY